jgi:hypothetical protein
LRFFFKELFRVFEVKKKRNEKNSKKKNRSFWSRETEIGEKKRDTLLVLLFCA